MLFHTHPKRAHKDTDIILPFLLVILLVSAAIIIVAVLFQKSNEDGLSGSISGGAETFYGKDKSAHTERKLFKWTVIFSVIFALCVLAIYVIQPDYAETAGVSSWKDLSQYAAGFKG